MEMMQQMEERRAQIACQERMEEVERRRQEAAQETTMCHQEADREVERRRQERQDESTSEPAVGASGTDDDEYVSANGLASRKRMHLEYQITSKNDVDRRGGNQETYITVSAAQG